MCKRFIGIDGCEDNEERGSHRQDLWCTQVVTPVKEKEGGRWQCACRAGTRMALVLDTC